MYNIEVDKKWNAYWLENKMFKFDKDDTKRQLFVIDVPPPNTTGDLHMGQTYWVSYVDSLARYKRMKGYNVLYRQGWDAQGFPVEIAAEKKYGKGLSRDEFRSKCVEIASNNIKILKEQMRLMGASFDESLEFTTMSKEHWRKVQLTLLMMYDGGMLYRAKHPVLWCPYCNSSIAREETEDMEKSTALNHILFSIEGSADKIEIATTRPELLHACVAVAVNPGDERYKKLIGKTAETPIFNKKVEIIADDIVDKEFGTGAEMVCTFGDKDDMLMVYKHKLPIIEAMDGRGFIINADKYNGMPAEKAREQIIADIKASGALPKQESINHTIKIHDKCGTAVELLTAMQWFIKIKDHAERIKETAASIKWIPESEMQRLYDWANYIEWDWNISRQRTFGTPIPFWYCESCGYILKPEEGALPVDPAKDKPKEEKCPKCGQKLKGETDTCDVWVDSSFTPLVVAGWPDDKKLMERAFPSSIRINGRDIIRSWDFYTIHRVRELTGEKPWEKILAHGMILGPDGKEMHKSAGNGINPLDLMAKYPVDTIRMWVALSGSLGKDKVFSYEDMDYFNSFLRKLENSANVVWKAIEAAGKVTKAAEEPHKYMNIFDLWILDRLNAVIKEVTEGYDSMELFNAASPLVQFYWHEFCDYYIEDVKHRIYSEEESMHGSKKAAAYTLKTVLDATLRMLAPIAPHICEEINSRFSAKSIFTEEFPKYAEKPEGPSFVLNGVVFSSDIVEVDYSSAGVLLNDIIADVRKQKAAQRLALNKEITSININVPEEYYKAVEIGRSDLKSICKASEVKLSKAAEYSVSIEV